ncbi:hypothetical protein [Massilia sp. IC2-476]|uniref:hypothetical protein n=1 Tax=Massilia sp. IC2-476 TaxID=2887199 RepID=UPI001D118763|nr:hypothetical protein [Massilia sp. IC2-476]MCC2974220.1 hypothetical protein [Massilia sp. IC2-476]
MKCFARSLLLSLFVFTAAAPALACAVLSPEQVAQKRKEGLETMKKDVRALMDEADQVFIGYLGKLTYRVETREPEARFPNIVHVNQAHFRNVQQIKGAYKDDQPLEFVTSQTRIVVGCGYRDIRDSNPGDHGAGETFLVYAKDGKILRTSLLPHAPVGLMDGQQEADFLRTAQ